MADDDDRTSETPEVDEAAKRDSIIRLAVPPWMVVFNVGGTLLAVRMMMTTSYVEPWRLEKFAAIAALAFGIVTAIKVVLVTTRKSGMPARVHVLKQLAIVTTIAAFPTLLPAMGCLALANRVGRLDDTTVLRCDVERIEARARLKATKNVVFYACAAPDGTTLRGHADEAFSVDAGGRATLLAARGRLGAWIRVGAPEPIRP